MTTQALSQESITAELRRARRRLEDALVELQHADVSVVDLRRIDAETSRLRSALTDLDDRLDERWEETADDARLGGEGPHEEGALDG